MKEKVLKLIRKWNKYVEESCHLERGRHEFVEWAIEEMFSREFKDRFYELLDSQYTSNMRIVDHEGFLKAVIPAATERCIAAADIFDQGQVLVYRLRDHAVLARITHERYDKLKKENEIFLWPQEEE